MLKIARASHYLKASTYNIFMYSINEYWILCLLYDDEFMYFVQSECYSFMLLIN